MTTTRITTLLFFVLQFAISGLILGETSSVNRDTAAIPSTGIAMESPIAKAIVETETVQPDSTREWVITIHAGHLDRTQTPVWVLFPFPIEDGAYELRQTAMTQRPTGGMQRGEQMHRPMGGMQREEQARRPVDRMQRRDEMRQRRMQMEQVGPNHPVPGVIQVEDQRGLLVLPHLPAGRSVELVMNLKSIGGDEPAAGENQMAGRESGQTGNALRHEMGETRLSFFNGDRPLFSYLHETEPVPPGVDERHERGGYIHPLYTPSGRNVVKHFNDGRPHQYALWSTWYRTEVDGELVTFWSSLEEDGRVRPDGIRQVNEGPVAASFVASNRFFDLIPAGESTGSMEVWNGGGQEGDSGDFVMEPILYETWQVTMVPDLGRAIRTPTGGDMNPGTAADGPGRYHLLDIVLTQEVAGEKEVKILEGGYGGISVRGPDEWNRDGAMTFLSSEDHHRNNVQNEPIRWGQLFGELEGEMAGIAILAAPPSVHFPLHPAPPIGGFINQSAEPFFSLGPAALGEFLITPGAPWRGHYRVVVHDGDLPARVLDRIWNDLASPPVVEVSRR